MQEVYRLFASEAFDLSEEAALAMYIYESTGRGDLTGGIFGGPSTAKTVNGWFIAKQWLNVTVAMWLEDIRTGLVTRKEIYEWHDPQFHWWLDRIFK